jgi:hypothetical protein
MVLPEMSNADDSCPNRYHIQGLFPARIEFRDPDDGNPGRLGLFQHDLAIQ